MSFDSNQLKCMLEKNGKSLSTFLVLVELTNCDEICQLFADLGVVHVIGFEAKYKNNANSSTLYEIQETKLFMDLFSKQFLSSVLTDEFSILKAKNIAFRSAKEKISKNLKD